MPAQPWQTILGKYWYLPAALILMVIMFLAGSWYGQRQAAEQKVTSGHHILHYVDPMNPAHTSSEPGLAPCGMKMEPVYSDDGGQGSGSGKLLGTGALATKKQQLTGVRVATVENSPYTFILRTVGKVAVDDNRTYRLNAFIDGWIVKVFNPTVGSLVKRDEPLATYFNQDLPSTLQTYYYAIDSINQQEKEQKVDPWMRDMLLDQRFPGNPSDFLDQQKKPGQKLDPRQRDLLRAQRLTAEGVLMNLGMSQLEIDTLARTRKLAQEITIFAPATSVVLARTISSGQRFAAGEELYRLADLSRVWILADLNESEAQYIRSGEKVTVTLPDQKEKRTATVSAVLPLFDPETQALKVRLEIDNPNYVLTPGMLVNVEFPIKVPATVNVPIGAVIDSGVGQTVFIERGNGFFEPRQIKTGWRLGDRVQILEGLKPGERIAISSNFLIDSESRMKLAAAEFTGKVLEEPGCDMDRNKARINAANRRPLQEEVKPPHEYHGSRSSQNQEIAAAVRDPVCGLTVEVEGAKQARRTSNYQGKTYYFDTDGCKQRFDNNPQRYLSGGADGISDSSNSLPAYPTVQSGPDSILQYKRKLRKLIPFRYGSPLNSQKILPQLPDFREPQGGTSKIPSQAQVRTSGLNPD